MFLNYKLTNILLLKLLNRSFFSKKITMLKFNKGFGLDMLTMSQTYNYKNKQKL